MLNGSWPWSAWLRSWGLYAPRLSIGAMGTPRALVPLRSKPGQLGVARRSGRMGDVHGDGQGVGLALQDRPRPGELSDCRHGRGDGALDEDEGSGGRAGGRAEGERDGEGLTNWEAPKDSDLG